MPYRRIVLTACLLTVVALSAAALASDPCGGGYWYSERDDTLFYHGTFYCGGVKTVTTSKRPIPVADTSVAADDSTSVVINDSIVTTVRRGPVITITKIHITEKDSVLPWWHGEFVISSPKWFGDTLVFTRGSLKKVLMPRINWKVAADDSTTVVINDTVVTTTRRGNSITVSKKVPIAAPAPARPKPASEPPWKSGETTVTLSPDGTLRISGAGAMRNYDIFGDPPWYNFRSSITGVIIEEGVTHIGDCAFIGLSGLKSVAIPNSVASTGARAFWGCTGLTSITVAADHARYSSVDGVLFNKNKTALIHCPPGKIGAYTIPGSVKSIGKHAFQNCAGLTSVTIPGSMANIKYGAFYNCAGLKSVTFEDGVKFIGRGTFYECPGLASIIVKSPKPPEMESYALDIDWNNVCLYVPASSIDAYRAAFEWWDFNCVKDLESAPGGE